MISSLFNKLFCKMYGIFNIEHNGYVFPIEYAEKYKPLIMFDKNGNAYYQLILNPFDAIKLYFKILSQRKLYNNIKFKRIKKVQEI